MWSEKLFPNFLRNKLFLSNNVRKGLFDLICDFILLHFKQNLVKYQIIYTESFDFKNSIFWTEKKCFTEEIWAALVEIV